MGGDGDLTKVASVGFEDSTTTDYGNFTFTVNKIYSILIYNFNQLDSNSATATLSYNYDGGGTYTAGFPPEFAHAHYFY